MTQKKSLTFGSGPTGCYEYWIGCDGCVALIGGLSTIIYTPVKFNMEPEKKSLEKVIPFGNHHFQVPC